MDRQHRGNEDRLTIPTKVVVLGTAIGSLISYGHVSQAKLAFSHRVTIVIAAELVVFAVLLRRRTSRLLRTFFTSATHPLNLALFRIVVFCGVFSQVRLATIISFSRIPAGLRIAPWGMGTILNHLPINQRWAATAGVLVLIFSVTGLLGLFSRTSALLCLIFGLYALGIPQFYGKVDHYNHLLWFAALLAVSPSGAFLAVDAIFAARRRADQGITEPPRPSREYALPLRFATLLIGIIYFFPGFWKLWDGGFDWVFTDNLQKQLHLFWTWSLNCTWLPSFRIDRHPFLCSLGAAGALMFELSFIFLMFSRRLRKLAALAGVVFHGLTYRFMRISFSSLQWSYVALFDWRPVCRTVGHWLYPKDMFFLFDGDCRRCCRTVASLRVCDVLERVTYLNLRDRDAVPNAAVSWLNPDQTKSDVQARTESRQWDGLAAYRALAARIPLLWPSIPILYLFPSGFGRVVHRETADNQACAGIGSRRVLTKLHGMRARSLGVMVVGTTLVLACSFCGANKIISGWPFACYPTFSLPASEKLETLGLVVVTASGESVPVEITAISPDRLYWVLANILATRDRRLQQDRLRDLWTFAVQSDPRLMRAIFVRFYRQTWSTIPELWESNPRDRHLLFELALAPCADPVASSRSPDCPP